MRSQARRLSGLSLKKLTYLEWRRAWRVSTGGGDQHARCGRQMLTALGGDPLEAGSHTIMLHVYAEGEERRKRRVEEAHTVTARRPKSVGA